MPLPSAVLALLIAAVVVAVLPVLQFAKVDFVLALAVVVAVKQLVVPIELVASIHSTLAIHGEAKISIEQSMIWKAFWSNFCFRLIHAFNRIIKNFEKKSSENIKPSTNKS